jgi:hypothetical protein
MMMMFGIFKLNKSSFIREKQTKLSDTELQLLERSLRQKGFTGGSGFADRAPLVYYLRRIEEASKKLSVSVEIEQSSVSDERWEYYKRAKIKLSLIKLLLNNYC